MASLPDLAVPLGVPAPTPSEAPRAPAESRPAIAPNRTALAPTLLIDELARSGVRHACIAPGSRSAPLVSALVAHGGLRLWSHVDERSGGFFALGLARALREPVAIVCTSGTAVANLAPAVVEAFHARLPLVLLTADRPPELRDCAAPQTIDQIGFFGRHVRWFFELGTPEPTLEAMRHLRAVACRAAAAARGALDGPPGPVHLNLAFREPLHPCPRPGDFPAEILHRLAARGRDETPWTRVVGSRADLDADAVAEIAALLRRARRPLVVAGPLDDPGPGTVRMVAALCAALRAPLLADVASNLRDVETRAFTVDAHDAVVRAFAGDAARSPGAPDAILRLGGPPTSKALATWLAAMDGVPQLQVDPFGGWVDPASVASHLVRAPLARFCAAVVQRLAADGSRSERGGERSWLQAWQDAGRRAREAIDASLAGGSAAGPPHDRGTPPTFEAHAVTVLARALPPGALLYVGNSLAVRALDAFWPADVPPPRVLLNRGANGIDGFASSVLGAAAASPWCRVVGVCGDLSFYHDLNGLLAAHRHGVRATFVVLDNDGGGIFDHLPIAGHPEGYERFFATPHGLDLQPAVEMYGAAFERAGDPGAFAAALERALAAPHTAVVELRIDRRRSLEAWTEARERAVRAASGRER